MCLNSVDAYLVFVGYFLVGPSFHKAFVEDVVRLWRKLLYVFHNLYDSLLLSDCLHYRVGIYVGY